MIRRMRKILILAHHLEQKGLLEDLRHLGVIHLNTKVIGESEEIEKLESQKAEWRRIHQLLDKLKEDANVMEAGSIADVEKLKHEINTLTGQLDHLKQQRETLQKERSQLEPWGQFNWLNIEKLQEKGLYTFFYQGSKKELNALKIDQDVALEVIGEKRNNVHFIIISPKNENYLSWEPLSLPKKSLEQIDSELDGISSELDRLEKELKQKIQYVEVISDQLEKSEEMIELAKVNSSFDKLAEGNIISITGWVPLEDIEKTSEFLDHNKISYTIKDAEAHEKVPIKLKNKKYSAIFEQITRIFQLPNYYEYDLTPLIAVFYPIFFAYCLGDAGYGVVLLTVSLIGLFTFFKNAKNLAFLGAVLGIMTLITGIIKSGVIFGMSIPEYQNIPFFKWLSQFIIVTDAQGDIFNSFNVALMIGVFQILIAVMVSIFKKIKFLGFVYGLSNMGKFIIIISLLVLFLGAMQELDPFTKYTTAGFIGLGVGVLMVLLFHYPDRPVHQRIAGGVLPLYFIVTGFMGDTLSYIRLFALGVASSILGLVVNQIGNQIMADAGTVMIIVGVLFLIVGHAFNMALASLGAFVHPLRLTFVEFYNNAEFEGGGIPYRPFKPKREISTITTHN